MNHHNFSRRLVSAPGFLHAGFRNTDGNEKSLESQQLTIRLHVHCANGHESAGFTSLVESFNYSVDGLKKTFGKRLTPYQCEMLGVDGKQVGPPAATANLVYGDRINNSRGDGWKYRGRGLLQITGRENYAKCGAALKLDSISTPELLTQGEAYAFHSAAVVFHITCCPM